jgi:hypothetical protein
MFEKLGGRKFVATVLIIGIGVLIDIFAKNGLSGNMLQLLEVALIGFTATNAVAGILATRGIVPPQADPVPNPEMEEMRSSINRLTDGTRLILEALNKALTK